MVYKMWDKKSSFAYLPIERFLERNRSVKMMDPINEAVKWRNIEALMIETYDVGHSKEGDDVYSSLMLLKCLLLQK